MSDTKEKTIDTVIKRYEKDKGMLIPMLQDIQAEFGYLPPDTLRSFSKKIEIPLAKIYSVATFYSSFRLAPKGRHEITLCMGTVCYLKGANKILNRICEDFSVDAGGTTEDRLFSLNAVNCVGACALAPVIIVDGKYYDGVTPESAVEIISKFNPNTNEGKLNKE